MSTYVSNVNSKCVNNAGSTKSIIVGKGILIKWLSSQHKLVTLQQNHYLQEISLLLKSSRSSISFNRDCLIESLQMNMMTCLSTSTFISDILLHYSKENIILRQNMMQVVRSRKLVTSSTQKNSSQSLLQKFNLLQVKYGNKIRQWMVYLV